MDFQTRTEKLAEIFSRFSERSASVNTSGDLDPQSQTIVDLKAAVTAAGFTSLRCLFPGDMMSLDDDGLRVNAWFEKTGNTAKITELSLG